MPHMCRSWGAVDEQLATLWQCATLHQWFGVVESWQCEGRLAQLAAVVGGVPAVQPPVVAVAGGGAPHIARRTDYADQEKWAVKLTLPLTHNADNRRILAMQVQNVRHAVRACMRGCHLHHLDCLRLRESAPLGRLAPTHCTPVLQNLLTSVTSFLPVHAGAGLQGYAGHLRKPGGGTHRQRPVHAVGAGPAARGRPV